MTVAHQVQQLLAEIHALHALQLSTREIQQALADAERRLARIIAH